MAENQRQRLVEDFMYFGYSPRSLPRQEVIQRVLDRISPSAPPEGICLETEGANRMRAIMTDIVAAAGDRPLVVPISGGLDSRLILATLMEVLTAERIKTVTVGVPGAFDYEFGCRVAEWAGTDHTVIDLNQVHFSKSALLDLEERTSTPTKILASFCLYNAFERFSGNHIFISGFMGDPLAGSRLPKKDMSPLKYFLEKNSYLGRMPASRYFESYLLDCDDYAPHGITSYDQLDFFIRQRSFIYPLFRDSGRNVVHPFCDHRWLSFWLSVPFEQRVSKTFFKKFLRESFPAAFGLPTKGGFGASLHDSKAQIALRHFIERFRSYVLSEPDRMLNYIDFNHAFRTREDLIETAEGFLSQVDLHGVDLGAEPLDFLYRHISEKADNTKMLQVLIGLGSFQVARGLG